MSEENLTSLHTWPFEYDPSPLLDSEHHVIVRKGKGRNEMTPQERAENAATIDKDFPEKRQFNGGATSTKGHRYELIPANGLACAADRFELGLIKYPNGCYNNLTNQKPLSDREWLIERLSHAIQHCMNAIRTLGQQDGTNKFVLPFDKSIYDDAGAIAFCGLVLGEAVYESYQSADKVSKEPIKDSSSSEGTTPPALR